MSKGYSPNVWNRLFLIIIRSETQKMQILAKIKKENTLRKKDERCFTYRDKNHFKKDGPEKVKKKKNSKNLPLLP